MLHTKQNPASDGGASETMSRLAANDSIALPETSTPGKPSACVRFMNARGYFENWVRRTSGNQDADTVALQAHTLCNAWWPLVDEEIAAPLVAHLEALQGIANGFLKIATSQETLNAAIPEFWLRHEQRQAAKAVHHV
jgi:hypothetical protein